MGDQTVVLPKWCTPTRGIIFGKRTAWSHLYFLNYSLLWCLPQSQILGIALYVSFKFELLIIMARTTVYLFDVRGQQHGWRFCFATQVALLARNHLKPLEIQSHVLNSTLFDGLLFLFCCVPFQLFTKQCFPLDMVQPFGKYIALHITLKAFSFLLPIKWPLLQIFCFNHLLTLNNFE